MEAYLGHVDFFHKVLSTSTENNYIPKPNGARSFVDVLLNKVSESLSLPPLSCAPQQKKAYVSVKVNHAAFQERLDLCKFSLIGRLILSKGNKPWPLVELRTKLASLWKISRWRLISLGKGYFQILLCSKDEKAKVWSMGSMNLSLGFSICFLGIWILTLMNKRTLMSRSGCDFMIFHRLIDISKFSLIWQGPLEFH